MVESIRRMQNAESKQFDDKVKKNRQAFYVVTFTWVRWLTR